MIDNVLNQPCPSVSVTTEEELGQAIKDDAISIEINNPKLSDHVLKIKATGKVSWVVALGALGIAVGLVILKVKASNAEVSTQTGSAISFTGAAAGTAVAAGILGKAAIAATSIAVAAGGVGALTSLRDKYKIVERTENKLVLKHK